MDREEIERCLQQLQAYRASGQRATEWAAAHGVTVRQLGSWSTNEALWRARLNGEVPARRGRGQAAFVAAALPASTDAQLKVELPGAGGGAIVYWPLAYARELAAWLREMRG